MYALAAGLNALNQQRSMMRGLQVSNTGAGVPHLAAEGAEVLGMLRDFHLLDDLTQGSTIACAVLACDPNLLRPLRLHSKPMFKEQ